jgi:hypothetical protein
MVAKMAENNVTTTVGGQTGAVVIEGVPGKAATNKRSGGRGRGSGSQLPPGSTFMVAPGTRIEKGYPLTLDEFWLLGSLGVSATAFFAIGSGLFGYYIDAGMNLALSQGVAEKVVAYYESSRHWALYGAIAAYVVGAALSLGSGLKIRAIVRRTKHPDLEQDVSNVAR